MAARYITTDLCLKARFDLRPLAERLEAGGLVCLGEPRPQGGVWTAVLEMVLTRGNAEHEIESVLTVIEGLDEEFRLAWDRCLSREFDLGFECQGGDLSARTLIKSEIVRRIAALDGTIGVTIYRESEPQTVET